MKKLLVYGTLKRGYGNAHWLRDAIYLRDAFVPGFTLWGWPDFGNAFPIAVPRPGGEIKGELFAVEDRAFTDLDQLEGVPYLFDRMTVTTTEGEQVECYFMTEERAILREARALPSPYDCCWNPNLLDPSTGKDLL